MYPVELNFSELPEMNRNLKKLLKFRRNLFVRNRKEKIKQLKIEILEQETEDRGMMEIFKEDWQKYNDERKKRDEYLDFLNVWLYDYDLLEEMKIK